MTIRHWEIFLSVCSCESMTEAAQKLNLTQPAVSASIRELEEFYQTQLFLRKNRRVYLTEAGEILRQYAAPAIRQLWEVKAILQNRQNLTICRIGVTTWIGETELPKILNQLKRQIPELEIEVFIDGTENIQQMLFNNQIDFALTDLQIQDDEWSAILLYQEQFAAVCTPGLYPKDETMAKELFQKKLLLKKGSNCERSFIESIMGEYKDITPVVESASNLSLLRLVGYGTGIAVLPRKMVTDKLASGALKAFPLSVSLVQPCYLIYKKEKHRKAVLEMAISYLSSDTFRCTL